MESPRKYLLMYHATAEEHAKDILKNGFDISKCKSTGCLGKGIYFARYDTAKKFAENEDKFHNWTKGAVIKCVISYSNPKF